MHFLTWLCCCLAELTQLGRRLEKDQRSQRKQLGSTAQLSQQTPVPMASPVPAPQGTQKPQDVTLSTETGPAAGGQGRSLHMMQEGWLLPKSIHQERSTPFLDKTSRQTGAASLPSPRCPRVAPRLQHPEPGCPHPPGSMNHVQNYVQQCYPTARVKYFQFLLRFSPAH